MNNYLIFLTYRIGDFFISSILIKSIIENDPKANIIIIASDKNYSYIKQCSYVNQVYLFKNNFFDKILLIFKLLKNNFHSIIIHDDKNRSKLISFFLLSKIFKDSHENWKLNFFKISLIISICDR